MAKTIFFDYDGTIHESLHIYRPAVEKAIDFLHVHGYSDVKLPNETTFYSFIGKNPQDMWETFVPYVPVELRNMASDVVSVTMKELVIKGEAKWYPNAKETLEELKKQGHQLILISNCKNYYLEVHDQQFHLAKYFDKLIASEAFSFQSKTDIIYSLLDNTFKSRMMVGDRLSDIEAGKHHHMFTIGAKYGYGTTEEMQHADVLIQSIKDVLKFV